MNNFYEELANYCNYLLNNYPDAKPYRDYLLKRLPINKINEYKLGYFPGNNDLNILLSSINKQDLVDHKLLYIQKEREYKSEEAMMNSSIFSSVNSDNKYSFFTEHRLIIPYYDIYDNILGFAGRTLLQDQDRQELGISKYKNDCFNKADHLFNFNKAKEYIKKENKIILVEGQFDSISCADIGINNVVALGCSSLSAKQFALILRYTNNIYLLLDNDESGKKGRELIAKKYSKYCNINNVYLPDVYKDVDDFLKDNSIHDFRFFFDI